MLNEIFNLIKNDNRFENEIYSSLKSALNSLNYDNHCLFSHSFNDTIFYLRDGVYTMELKLESDSKASDISIKLDNNKTLFIDYNKSIKQLQTTMKMSIRIPSDSDAETLEANIIDDKLVITIKQAIN